MAADKLTPEQRERKREQDRLYRLRKGEEIREKARLCQLANPIVKPEWDLASEEDRRAYLLKYSANSLDELRQRWRDNYFANREAGLARSREYHKTHRDEIAARTRIYRASPEYVPIREKANAARKDRYKNGNAPHHRDRSNRILWLLRVARYRAGKVGVEFDPSLLKTLSEVPPSECGSCHLPLDYSYRGGRNRNRSPSVDRFVNSKGYVAGNTNIICWRCNSLKKDASVEEIEAVLAYMRSSPTAP
jgi:hypothetical protein